MGAPTDWPACCLMEKGRVCWDISKKQTLFQDSCDHRFCQPGLAMQFCHPLTSSLFSGHGQSRSGGGWGSIGAHLTHSP